MLAANGGHTDCVKELFSSRAVLDKADNVSSDTKLMCLYVGSTFVTITSFAIDEPRLYEASNPDWNPD